MWQEQKAVWPCCIHTQEAGNKQEMGPGNKASRPAPSNPHIPAEVHLLKVPQASQTVHQLGTKHSNRWTYWGTFQIQATVLLHQGSVGQCSGCASSTGSISHIQRCVRHAGSQAPPSFTVRMTWEWAPHLGFWQCSRVVMGRKPSIGFSLEPIPSFAGKFTSEHLISRDAASKISCWCSSCWHCLKNALAPNLDCSEFKSPSLENITLFWWIGRNGMPLASTYCIHESR